MLWTKLLALGMIFCVGTMMVFVTWRSRNRRQVERDRSIGRIVGEKNERIGK